MADTPEPNCYEPMKARLVEFRRAWSGDAAGLDVIAELDAETDMYERWSHVQGYEFFVSRRLSRGRAPGRAGL